MGTRSLAWILLIVLAAFVWGAWDLVVWAWNELTADQQIKWAIGLSLLFGGILVHLIMPFTWLKLS